MNAQSVTSYDATSKMLHWLIAALAFSQLALGKFFDVDAEESAGVFTWHTTLGLLVLVLMLARVGWRLSHAAPPPPANAPPWQNKLGAAMHGLLYVLLLVLPLSGWLLASAEGDAVSFIGLFDIPALPVPAGEEAEDFLEETHELLGNALLVLAGLHVLAGLKHHYVDRDDVLRRMLPG